MKAFLLQPSLLADSLRLVDSGVIDRITFV